MLALVLNCGVIQARSSDRDLIRETEKLLNTLPMKDSSRPQLALRVADMCFDESVRAAQDISGKTDPIKESAIFRAKAMKYYTIVLTGFDGLFDRPSGSQKHKINFQVARLLTEEGNWSKAEPLWRGLLAQSELKPLKREAALRLAEKSEQQNTSASLKEAQTHYTTALDLCEGGDVCSYIHFRRAWILSNQGQARSAVSEMELALYDAKGQIREESLRDYINFSAASDIPAQEMLLKVQGLEEKLNRPELSLNLAEAYYAQGRKPEGTFALEAYYHRRPELKHLARLLEETYGAREIEKFTDLLNEGQAYLTKLSGGAIAKAKELWAQDKESEKILRRLTVQLDGERQTKKDYSPLFKSTVMFYLSAFPASSERSKMIDGWMASEESNEEKLKQLALWISEENQVAVPAVAAKSIVKLREARASVAQKLNRNDVVIEEMTALLQAEKDQNSAASRRLRYIRAKSIYDSKDYDKSLVEFRALAASPFDSSGSKKPDNWAIQSQNLSLDILNIQKNFAAASVQADAWTKSADISAAAEKDPSLKTELKEMASVSQKARFEAAGAMGESKDALQVYLDYCLKDELKPQSCQNAKVLAVRLKDQARLITLLRKTGPESELAAELEAAGEFTEAAAIAEKSAKGKALSSLEQLRIALLFELGGAIADRDRVLTGLVASLRQAAKSPKSAEMQTWKTQEPLLYRTLLESKLALSVLWDLPWTAEYRLEIANQLELSGQSTPVSRKLLVETCGSFGDGWKRLASHELKELDRAQRGIQFYGPKGKVLFDRRMAAIKKFSDRADCYLKGSDSGYRVKVAASVSKAYKALETEIVSTPLPPELNEEQIQAVQVSLAEIAKPFADKASAYRSIAESEITKVGTVERAPLEAFYLTFAKTESAPVASLDSWTQGKEFEAKSARSEMAAVDTKVLGPLLSKLKTNPSDRSNIEKLKTELERMGQGRMAAYFAGRLAQLDGGK